MENNCEARIDAAVRKLIESGLASETALQGCSQDEIAELEKYFGVTLPAAYTAFLRRAGKRAGDFLTGTDFLYSELFSCREQAELLLKQCGLPWILRPEQFVFLCHQGYQFMFFETGRNDPDPAVNLFIEGEVAPKLAFDRFSDWLTRCVDDEIAACKALRHHR